MTNPADRYIEEVMRNVFATPEDRQRLETDLQSHFSEAEAASRAPREIIEGLGTPEEVAAAFNAEREFRYAGFWQRLVAFIGDLGLLTFMAIPVLGVGLSFGVMGEDPGKASIAWVLLCGLMVLALGGVYIFYFPLLESHYGKTLGKHLMGIRVLRENGAPIGLGQAFVRRLSLFFEMLWIDALFIPFTEKKQRALDIIAKTVVAREPGKDTGAGGYFLCLFLAAASLCCLVGLVAICGAFAG
jgi:uncharacterized RDD family membrane protein YckC